MSPSEIEEAVASGTLAQEVYRRVLNGAPVAGIQAALEGRLRTNPEDFDAVRAALWRVWGVRATLPTAR
jgi:hypothetical protein